MIRPLRREDAPSLHLLTDDPGITENIDFLPARFMLADAQALIAGNGPENCFLAVLRDTELIGVVGTHFRGDHGLEIGYWIGTAFHGRGYASEAVAGVIDRLRHRHPARQITAECRTLNTASWRVLHKLGFRPVGMPGKRIGRELLVLNGA